MRNEDLRINLLTLRNQREKVQAKVTITQEAINKIDYHRKLQRRQKQEINLLSELLRQVTEFASVSKDVEFFEAFANTTNDLRNYTFETIETYKGFVLQATTDPKTILPYTRTSKPLRT